MPDDAALFPGFADLVVVAPGARIHARVGGSGPVVLLLHGYPQTGAMWHPIAARLAASHTVVVPDLRGYGASVCTDDDFSFRAMAADVATLIERFGGGGDLAERPGGGSGDDSHGDDKAIVIGHDRGARTAHRLVLDRPELVERVALLDILPTTEVWERMTPEMIRAYYHWGFLARPEIAEPMIAGDPVRFLHSALVGLYTPLEAFHPEALAQYEEAIRRPGVIHAICGDYQAGATVDLEHDAADLHLRPDLPTLVLWGSRGMVGAEADPLEIWRGRLPRAEGRAIDAGHFLVEEAPEETWAAIEEFLAPG
ncbi:alpha/beta hydrolase [Rhodococcus sp. IEGM 1408]|uniref:alpha/beta fold hydrolase n=1 Tax=Rhodococcus sp. IEGM 1408 TaxID=3082220 RepID=UPI0029553517|nr:alpha/beta hydrolase [Rhodococcus sp. IEGM 1408]MDV7999897.1 alpha/beta hydrolase [Rhodococcus sp. IEGM 1408]